MKQIMQIVRYDTDTVTLKASKEVMQRLSGLFKKVINDKYCGYVQATLAPPYPSRSTGKGSQNSHIWGHIQQIANETGNDVDDIEDYIKRKAVKRGYPYKVNKLTGLMVMESMTNINTVEAGYLIDELHALAGDLGIILSEGFEDE